MKRLIHILKIVVLLLFAGSGNVSGQAYFRIISGIPYLPIIDPASVTSPETGMVIFSSVVKTPLIYTGTAWESLCTGSINGSTVEDYFVIKEGIPYIPVNNNYPAGTPEAGAIYYSTVSSSMMVYSGTMWNKLAELGSSSFNESPGFSTGFGHKTCKLPVLSVDPPTSGMTAGAFFINSLTKSLRFYNGASWQEISCGAILTTLTPADIKINTASSGGNVSSNGGSAITALGICWSLSPNPGVTLSTKTIQLPSGDGIGSFSSEMTALSPNTTYHVRAYAITAAGVSYGEDRSFTTDYSPPTIITAEATDILSTTAISGGDITFNGGADITARGIRWGTDPYPKNDVNATVTHDGSGVGPFTSTLTGLMELTTYYIQAYATNGRGTSYGNIVQFTTPPAVPPLLSASDIYISNITDISALGEGFILNNGGSPVTERGISWSTDKVNFQYAISASQADNGKFTAQLTGLSSGTTYYVRAYATNKAGTAYSTETSFITASYVTLITTVPSGITGASAISGGMISNTGQAQITSKGICWSTETGPSTALSTKTTQTVTGAGTGSFTSNITGLTPGQKYYVRAYAINTHGTAYGDEYSFTTLDLPGVTTTIPSSLMDNTAISGGNIYNDGGSPITYRGVCWSTEENPVISDSHTSNGSGGGTFISNVTGLQSNTIYHIRAYAINSTGIAYGADLTFTIATELPAVITTDVTDITNISAIAGGNITGNGGASITSRGIRLSTLPDPAADLDARIISKGTGDGSFTSDLTGLLGNTVYYIQAFAVNSYGTGYGTVKQFKTLQATAPVLSSIPPTIYGINNNTALSTVSIVNNGGAVVTECGIRWSVDGLTFEHAVSPNTTGIDIGTFICNIKNLTPGTTYYAQTYAINSVGTTYSEQVIFTTTSYTSLATLTTSSATNITGITAISGGHITNNGDALISSRGIIWSTSQENLTTSLTSKTIELVNGDGVGTYVSTMVDLLPATLYYVVAYAINGHGTAYGNVISMVTPGYPILTTTPISSLTGGSVTSGGNITFDGGAFITNRGACWSTTPVPVITDSHTSDGTGSGSFISDISGLTGSTKYYIRAYATNSAGTVYGNEISFNTAPAGLPTLITHPASDIGGTTAISGGTIPSDGGALVTKRGICWSTNSEPLNTGTHIDSGDGKGEFSVNLTGLLPGTKYYVRAYAVNSVGTVYGNEIVFSTFTTPTITTTAISAIKNISATSGGSIISDGGTKVTSSGICWNTTGSPVITSSHTASGTGTGSFIHFLSGLLGNTKYYVRAYATNNAGTAYGNELSFTTLAPEVPVLTTVPVRSGINGTTGLSGGNISSNGGAVISVAGVCWGIRAGFDPLTESVGKTIQSAADSFSSTLTSLIPGTTYYVRAYATNSAGTGYGANEVSFTTFTIPSITTSVPEVSTVTRNSAICGGTIISNGGTQITGSGICWSNTTTNPTLNDEYTSTGSTGIGSFLQTITGLLGSTTYNVRAYATNSAGTAYGNVEMITTLPPAPATLLTKAPTSMSSSTAISGGNITDDGGGMVSTRGIYWSTTANFNTEDATTSKTAQTGYYKGNFEATMTGLNPGTIYYVRAYVINSAGISYGNEVSFVMPSLPVVSTTIASSITSNTAITGGNITNNGGSVVTVRGVIWSTVPNFVPDMISDHITSNGSGNGAFSSSISGLQGNTTYYVRAYATNVVGTQFGNQLSFTTDPSGLATLVTSAASSITGTTAVSGGYISASGGAPVSTRGVVWSTVKNFDPETTGVNKTAQTGTSIGSFTSTLTGLSEGTTYYIRAYAINSTGTAYGNELSFTSLAIPSLTTVLPVASSSGTTASSGGTIISDGGAWITNQGVCWSTSTNPTTGLYTHTSYDPGNSSGFISKLVGLIPSTTYYIRAYAVNGLGTAYGNELIFTTPAALATLTTGIVTITSETTAESGGEITNDGGSPVTARGVKWSIDPNFNPDTVITCKTIDGTDIGTFTSAITGLKNSVRYYVRAYATTSAGTAYGNQGDLVIFPTSPILTTKEITHILGTTAKSGGDINRDGGAPIISRGIVWDTNHNPTISLPTKTVDNTSATIGSFTGNMTGLLANTQYYVRAYATNKIGTAYGLEIPFLTATLPTLTATNAVTEIAATHALSGGIITDDGRSPITTRGICWSMTSNPTLADAKTVDIGSSGIGIINGSMTGLKPNTLYYVRAYATNAVGTAYGSEVSFTTAAVLFPTLTTNPVTSISSVAVNSGGLITDDGGMPVTGRGICWIENSSVLPTTALSTTIYNSVGGIGNFNNAITGLTPATTYYVRAFAINSLGTAYGNLQTFTTLPAVPAVSMVAITNVTMSGAEASAAVTDNGGAPLTDRGLYWNTTGILSTSTDRSISNGYTGTSISGVLTLLTQSTKYYVWAYATNSAGTGYSIKPTVFSSLSLASLTTTKPTLITRTTARTGGNIISTGGATITDRGVCWSTSAPPTISHIRVSSGPGSVGSYTTDLSSLMEGTKYYIRAYAVSNMGVDYGNLDSITTLTTATVTTTPTTLVASATATSGGNITNDGGVPVTARGVCWSTTIPPIVDQPGTSKTTNGTGIGSFSSALTGLTPVTTYYVRAYATSAQGTSYGNLEVFTTLPVPPVVTNLMVATLTNTTASGSAGVTSDGGAEVTSRGICWNTTGNPVTTDNIFEGGAGIGDFAGELTGLLEGYTYYARAYATNSGGTGYSPLVTTFKICPSFTVAHIAGLNGAPVTKSVTYGSVGTNISGAIACWITQNLGADHEAVSASDPTEASAGWYWQFNKSQGYNYIGSSYHPSNAWTPWISSISENTGWAAANDPCTLLLSAGWRIPTSTEWSNADGAPQNWASADNTYASVLKLHPAGYMTYDTGLLTNRGTSGYYWSSTQYGAGNGYALNLGSSSSMTYPNKATATSLRCIRDVVVTSKPAVTNVTVPTSTMTASTAEGTATVTPDGGSMVTAKGLCWNTTGNPTIEDNPISGGSGTGAFTSPLTGLKEGITYYVRAYATNSVGTVYSPLVTSFKICPPEFTIIHTAGLNGSPETKTVTYHSVSTNISGSAACWLTQNLGADQEAVAADDANETAMGWYWQFNKAQGYKHDGSTRTPSNAWTAWITSISENTGWAVANDPCSLLLSGGWRIPTFTEWSNADAPPQNWTTASDAYSSVLKIHMAGYLAAATGALTTRGTIANYWSNSYYNAGLAYSFSAGISSSTTAIPDKANAFSLRCIRDAIIISRPSVSNVTVPTTSMTATTAEGSATVSLDGGAIVSARGLCWNTTGSPTIADSPLSAGTGTGDFNLTLTGLTEGLTYYVRAYATNIAGTTYSPDVTSFKICPPAFTVIHTAGLNGAPVTKTVTYHSVSSNISGAAACWLTQNLGADRQATSVNDNTEPSAGWYWQFNRVQGYKNDGTTRTPSNAWTAWITSISENINWGPASDPCTLLLSVGWRIPTYTEWTNADAVPQNWATAIDAYNSVLKLHPAGYMAYDTGILTNPGTSGYYWSSIQYGAGNGYALNLGSGSSVIFPNKAQASNLRCIRDAVVLSRPSVSNVTVPTSGMTASTAEGTATVSLDGGAIVTSRGFCWNTTGNPIIEDNTLSADAGTGTFVSTLSGLKEGITYYVRAYATNSLGTVYSPEITTFKLCPPTFTVIHTAGLNGAPETKTVTYHSVSTNISGSAACWLTQNLGADQEAISVTDVTDASAGWYWQFNRAQGYKPVGTSYIPDNAWTDWITSISENTGWAVASDPCNLLLSTGWRIPTSTEWSNADAPPQNWTTASDVYGSVLKLHLAGILLSTDGSLSSRGTSGSYWSNSYYNAGLAYALDLNGGSGMSVPNKVFGFPLRCIRDAVTIVRPNVSNVVVPTGTMTATTAKGTATVTPDGGALVTARGLCWNTTGTPTVINNIVPAGTGTGEFTATLTGLAEGLTYYVRAYATNSAGTTYSPEVTSFKICPPAFTVIHTAGLNGAPVTKTVTYHSVSSNISGTAACWLTQNLGADRQATSVDDNTETSAGWYWQFNRVQGYKHNGTTRIPSNAWTAWITSISENINWGPASDPCTLLLSGGWRIPTYTEWNNADAVPQNWATATDAYNSVLKLHPAGYMAYDTGVLTNRGTSGYYWGSIQYVAGNGYALNLGSSSSMTVPNKAQASNLRCIRDAVVLSRPSVSNVTVPTSGMTASTAEGTATVSLDGGAAVTSRGFCWNTTGNPIIEDNTIASGTGTGIFTSTLPGLKQGITYYVRAYATNSLGTVYSPDITTFKLCPPTFTVIHTAGLNGAPETKTVTYHSVSTNISGSAACWLTQNLGADQEAISAADATDASAGWYWQFNRAQGYKPVGTGYIPDNAWTDWITSISENTGWAVASDPCNLLLSTGWRIPTFTEWSNADAPPQNWTTASDAYSSVLKIHMAGYLAAATGALTTRGTIANYWSNSYYNAGLAYSFSAGISSSSTALPDKTNAFSLRCIRDAIIISRPSVSNVTVPTTSMTATTAVGTATVAPDGGAAITARGLCWNAIGAPTIADNLVQAGTGVGEFTVTLTGLTEGLTYYVRAYATNSAGTTYSPDVTSFKICPPAFTVIHTAGLNGAPVTKTVTYHSVSSNISGTAACWLTQNLGADRQATSVNDNTEPSAGWYWQFNRVQGYKNDGTTRTPSNAWTAWITSISENINWGPASDPCTLLLSVGWRIPTYTEWTNADAAPQYWATAVETYASVLKLHPAGYLAYDTGILTNPGSTGYYWSSIQYGAGNGYALNLGSGSSMIFPNKAQASNLRCIRDAIVIGRPSVSNVTVPTSAMTASTAQGIATVTLDGGATVTNRGLCWNATGNPSIEDNPIAIGTGTGIFTGTISGLKQGITYYVRAYAINSAGITYSPDITTFKLCPPAFTVIHTAGLNGAPETKTVTYHSVSTNISGSAACWLTQNLGADREAVSATDASSESAGWYWQFNRLQGYKSDGATYIPSNAWTGWTTSISENINWAVLADPCTQLLGNSWRIPTSTEWSNADAPPQNWSSAIDTYGSVLKLHPAGFMAYDSGELTNRGSSGNYWSNTQYSAGAAYVLNLGSNSSITSPAKTFGYSVRCIRDAVTVTRPSVSNVTVLTSSMTSSTAQGIATVTPDGGATVTARGLCWNTTGNPIIEDNPVSCDAGTGSFTGTLTGLKQGPTYYVRAYAINSAGTTYSPEVTTFKICPTTFTVIHTAGLNGAPVTKTVTYHSVSSNISGSAACWLTQNLGADRQATSVNDNTEPSAGWYWQFNRVQGYKNDGTTRTPSNAWTPWITSISEGLNWAAASDPCTLLLSSGWRIPTYTEWTNADAAPQFWTTAVNTYASVLKLHPAGYLAYDTGNLINPGTSGYYWSSTQYGAGNGYALNLGSGSSVIFPNKAQGSNLRCIRDAVVLSRPSVSNVTVPPSSLTSGSADGIATVTPDGGTVVTARGLCWNTTGTPTIEDNPLPNDSGTGIFTTSITGLKEGPTYYVRAYAINSAGITYSPDVTSFKICPAVFPVTHTAGTNGAPETKTINYHAVNSSISGTAKCWLSQNLGASRQASSATDASDGSAGWYWQFNRLQAYSHDGTTRTPSTPAWVASVSESANWSVANDPCGLMLSTGWRIPTYTEWNNADAPPQNWTSLNDAFGSDLKLHAAGYLGLSNGGLNGRGVYGRYWSSMQYTNALSYYLELYNGSMTSYIEKTYGFSLRCIKD